MPRIDLNQLDDDARIWIFGISPALALPAVLAYRTVAIWLPTPAAIAAVPALRSTIARWRGEASPSPAAVVPARGASVPAAA